METTEEMLYRAFNNLVIEEMDKNPTTFDGQLGGMWLMRLIGDIKTNIFLNAPDETLSEIGISRNENNEICERITEKILNKYLKS
jgi:hypothetical protein